MKPEIKTENLIAPGADRALGSTGQSMVSIQSTSPHQDKRQTHKTRRAILTSLTRRRSLLALLVSAFCILPSAFGAAVISDHLKLPTGAPLATNILFEPKSTPLLLPGLGAIPSVATNVMSAGDGAFSVQLLPGDYKVTIGGNSRDAFIISVPDASGTNSLQDLASSELGYIYKFAPQYEVRAARGQPNGYAGLDAQGNLIALPGDALRSSEYFTLTNIPLLVITASNYIGEFPQLHGYLFQTPLVRDPNAIIRPPMPVDARIAIRVNGGTWQTLSNGMQASDIDTNVQVSIVMVQPDFTNLNMPGRLILYGIDHPELFGITNHFDGQFLRIADPVDPTDAATKSYVDLAIANSACPFRTFETNGYYHAILERGGRTYVDIMVGPYFLPINSFAVDNPGTHGLLSIWETNLASGFRIEESTNLVFVNGWSPTTNYTAATNAGEVTFSIPIDFGQAYKWFRVTESGTNTAQFFHAPLIVNGDDNNGGGALEFHATTNTPTLNAIGNMKAARLWSSNGFLYVTGSTNGTSIYTKLLAP